MQLQEHYLNLARLPTLVARFVLKRIGSSSGFCSPSNQFLLLLFACLSCHIRLAQKQPGLTEVVAVPGPSGPAGHGGHMEVAGVDDPTDRQPC